MAHYFTNEIDLPSEIERVDITIGETNYYIYTDNGVFSKGKLDLGTEILLKTFEYNCPQEKKVLDIGCGCGPIGINLLKQGFTVDMSDINKRAIHLTKKALKEQNLNANVIESSAYENINNKYDYIISNPPIRVGKDVLYDIVMNAKKHLNQNGEVWLVVRKDKGAESLVRDMKKVYNTVDIVEKKKGYFIIKAC